MHVEDRLVYVRVVDYRNNKITQHALKSASFKSTEGRQHLEELNTSYLLEL